MLIYVRFAALPGRRMQFGGTRRGVRSCKTPLLAPLGADWWKLTTAKGAAFGGAANFGIFAARQEVTPDCRQFLVRKNEKFLELGGGADITVMFHPGNHRVVYLVVKEWVMRSSVLAELDLIEELRLRRWAREHYVPRSERRLSWHPVVHEEMSKKDNETGEEETTSAHYAWLKS
jgi:hypothetical protein